MWLIGDILSYAIMGRDTASGPNNSYGNNIYLPEDDRVLTDEGKFQSYGYYLGEPAQQTVVQNELRAGWLLEPRSGIMLELAWTYRAETGGEAPSLMTNYVRAGISSNLHNSHRFRTVRR